METWPHWGSFFFGVLCTLTVPWMAVICVIAIVTALRDARRGWRRVRDRAAVDSLLREVAPRATRGTW